MSNRHTATGRRLYCDGCNAFSPLANKATTWGQLKRAMRKEGWSMTLRRDFCPACTAARKSETRP